MRTILVLSAAVFCLAAAAGTACVKVTCVEDADKPCDGVNTICVTDKLYCLPSTTSTTGTCKKYLQKDNACVPSMDFCNPNDDLHCKPDSAGALTGKCAETVDDNAECNSDRWCDKEADCADPDGDGVKRCIPMKTIAIGAKCTNSDQCVKGSSCVSDGTNSVCTAQVALGAACHDDSERCPVGSYCKTTAADTVGVCSKFGTVAAGGECSAFMDCAKGLSCDYATNKCATPAADGTVCDPTATTPCTGTTSTQCYCNGETGVAKCYSWKMTSSLIGMLEDQDKCSKEKPWDDCGKYTRDAYEDLLGYDYFYNLQCGSAAGVAASIVAVVAGLVAALL